MKLSKRRIYLLAVCVVTLCSLLVVPLLQHHTPDVKPSIAKAIDFLKETNEPFPLLFLNIIYRRFGIEEFADALQRYDHILAEDPKDAPQLRLFRRIADYNSPLQVEDLEALSEPIDLLTVPALYCDRQLPSEFDVGTRDYLFSLYGAMEHGGYLVTHELLAIIWIRENGCEVPLNDDQIETMYKTNAELINTDSEVTDLEVEAAAFLYLAGQGKLVKNSFIERVIDAQNTDGSWGISNDRWHTTVLALLYLLHIRFPAKSYPPSLAPAP